MRERSCARGVGQAETINRLLKKQSKSKNKRNVLSTADDRTPMSATPAVVQSARDGSEAPEGEVLEPVELIPTMYRWISTTKPLPGGAEPDDSDGRMKLILSVPVSVLAAPPSETRLPPVEKPVCDVTGCEQARKYRLVRDWLKGACGMEHLEMLERQMDIV
jgi:Ino eighty subunit 2